MSVAGLAEASREAMGTIIQFPDSNRYSRDSRHGGQSEDATIIILPSVRVERHAESADGSDPNTKDSSPRSRRRRGSR
jgi:hypothetical protein